MNDRRKHAMNCVFNKRPRETQWGRTRKCDLWHVQLKGGGGVSGDKRLMRECDMHRFQEVGGDTRERAIIWRFYRRAQGI